MPDNGKYSYSKVDCYKQCPFKFLLKYVDNKYVPVSSIAFDVGTAIHDTEEKIANCIKDGLPIDYKALRNNLVIKMAELEKKFPKEWNEKDKAGRYYKEKFFGYLTSGIYRLENFCKEHPELEIVGAEIQFYSTLCGKSFNGKIDRLFRNKNTGKYLCQDIKTYPQLVEEKDLITPLQFVVYVDAIKAMYNVTNEDVQCQYDLPFCAVAQDAGTKGFMDRGFKKINQLFEGIDNHEYAPNPTALCYWCEYSATNPQSYKKNHLCPYHSLWTKDEKTEDVAGKWVSLEEYRKFCENLDKQAV